MSDLATEIPGAVHRDKLLQLCPELGAGWGRALPEDAQLSRSPETAARVRELLGDWQRLLARDARTAVEEREVRLLADHLALLDQLWALGPAAGVDPDPLARWWRLLLDQAALEPALGLRWLRALPRVLDEHRQQPLAPRALLLDHARRLADHAPQVLAAQVERLRAELPPPAAGELDAVVATCQQALHAHASWLQTLVPVTPPVVDDATLNTLYRLRHIPFAVAELRELLEQELAEWDVERARIARRLDASASMDELLARARVQPETAADGLSRLRGSLAAVHAHAEERHLLGPHKPPPLDLVAAPEHLRGPLADATPWLRMRAVGVAELWVLEPPASAPLSGLGAAELTNLAARQGIPGRAGLQLAAWLQASPLRAGLLEDAWPWGYTGWASDLVEGWPLYAAEMLREEGWDGSPAHALLLTEHARRTCLAARLDLDLARGAVDEVEAVRRAASELQLDDENARLQVVAWLRRPGASSSAVVGALRLFEARRDGKVQWGAGFTLGDFHHALLAAGRVPVDEAAAWLGEQPGGRA